MKNDNILDDSNGFVSNRNLLPLSQDFLMSVTTDIQDYELRKDDTEYRMINALVNNVKWPEIITHPTDYLNYHMTILNNLEPHLDKLSHQTSDTIRQRVTILMTQSIKHVKDWLISSTLSPSSDSLFSLKITLK